MPFVKTSFRFGQSRVVLEAGVSNPPARGRAAQEADAAPVTDNVVGPDGPRDGRRRRRGILVGLLVISVGLLCCVAYGSKGSSTQPYPDGQIVRGTVVAVHRHVYTRKARRYVACTVEVEYTFAHQATVASDDYATVDQCTMKGQQVDVSVRGSDVATARVVLPSAQPMLMIGQLFAGFWVAIGAWILLASLLGRRRPVPDGPTSGRHEPSSSR